MAAPASPTWTIKVHVAPTYIMVLGVAWDKFTFAQLKKRKLKTPIVEFLEEDFIDYEILKDGKKLDLRKTLLQLGLQNEDMVFFRVKNFTDVLNGIPTLTTPHDHLANFELPGPPLPSVPHSPHLRSRLPDSGSSDSLFGTTTINLPSQEPTLLSLDAESRVAKFVQLGYSADVIRTSFLLDPEADDEQLLSALSAPIATGSQDLCSPPDLSEPLKSYIESNSHISTGSTPINDDAATTPSSKRRKLVDYSNTDTPSKDTGDNSRETSDKEARCYRLLGKVDSVVAFSKEGRNISFVLRMVGGQNCRIQLSTLRRLTPSHPSVIRTNKIINHYILTNFVDLAPEYDPSDPEMVEIEKSLCSEYVEALKRHLEARD